MGEACSTDGVNSVGKAHAGACVVRRLLACQVGVCQPNLCTWETFRACVCFRRITSFSICIHGFVTCAFHSASGPIHSAERMDGCLSWFQHYVPSSSSHVASNVETFVAHTGTVAELTENDKKSRIRYIASEGASTSRCASRSTCTASATLQDEDGRTGSDGKTQRVLAHGKLQQ